MHRRRQQTQENGGEKCEFRTRTHVECTDEESEEKMHEDAPQARRQMAGYLVKIDRKPWEAVKKRYISEIDSLALRAALLLWNAVVVAVQ